MSTSFEKYSDILLDAYLSNARSGDVAAKKKEILDELFSHYDLEPDSILFIGFSPGVLRLNHSKIYLTEVSATVCKFFEDSGIKFTYIDPKMLHNHSFSAVIAVDEYLTFADSDQDQRDKVTLLSKITKDFVVTTLRDYKNQDFKDREFSQPIAIRNSTIKKIYFEHYEYDQIDRNSCLGTSYTIEDDGVTVVGPFTRRSMYFKQLAKFSLDAGAKSFLVHKNLMHKSIIKKNYEHIITIRY